ncbi:MAG: hypothetical protein ACOCRO_03935 [Halanaerobiales bacterium]
MSDSLTNALSKILPEISFEGSLIKLEEDEENKVVLDDSIFEEIVKVLFKMLQKERLEPIKESDDK